MEEGGEEGEAEEKGLGEEEGVEGVGEEEAEGKRVGEEVGGEGAGEEVVDIMDRAVSAVVGVEGDIWVEEAGEEVEGSARGESKLTRASFGWWCTQ